ncbi:MAG: hypothetical protein R3B09_04315 [Nannocystaceae bacterium]
MNVARRRLVAPSRLLLGLLPLALAACGDDPILAAEVDELCGQVGPYRLLPLEPDERLTMSAIRRVDDRYFVTVGREPRLPDGPLGALPRYGDTTTYSVGLCGEDPRVVAHDLGSAPFPMDRWPGALFGCVHGEERDDLVLVDPSGDQEATLVLEDGCTLYRSHVDEGMVRAEAGEATLRLVYHPYLDGDVPGYAAPIELFAAVTDYTVLGDEVLGVGEDGVLRAVSLVDLSTTVEASGVVAFAATADHLLWKSTGADASILLRDRQSGTEAVIEHGDISPWGFSLDAEFGRIHRPSTQEGEVLVDLEGGGLHYFTDNDSPVRELADGRWLVRNGSAGPFRLRDLDTEVEVILSEREGFARTDDDHLDLVEGVQGYLDTRDVGPLWRLGYDGSPEVLRAKRVTALHVVLDDGRRVTPVDVDDAWLGTLVVVDPATLEEERIDAPVFNYTSTQAAEAALDPQVIAYQVVDGDRTGLYLLRLAE